MKLLAPTSLAGMALGARNLEDRVLGPFEVEMVSQEASFPATLHTPEASPRPSVKIPTQLQTGQLKSGALQIIPTERDSIITDIMANVAYRIAYLKCT